MTVSFRPAVRLLHSSNTRRLDRPEGLAVGQSVDPKAGSRRGRKFLVWVPYYGTRSDQTREDVSSPHWRQLAQGVYHRAGVVHVTFEVITPRCCGVGQRLRNGKKLHVSYPCLIGIALCVEETCQDQTQVQCKWAKGKRRTEVPMIPSAK
jgi:hypothetical protein